MDGDVRWVLRLGEIGLKSKPVRRMFQRSLKRSIAAAAKRWGIDLRPSFTRDQIIVRSQADVMSVEEALCHQLGIVAIDRVRLLGDMNNLQQTAAHLINTSGRRGEPRTFGVRCRRVGNVEGWTSPSFAAALGSALIAEDSTLRVDLASPSWPVRVHLTTSGLELVERRLTGPGGLPAGSQGDVLILLDSEQALASGFLIMRRGCRLLPVQGSDPTLVERLRAWDGNIGHRSMHHAHDGTVQERASWGLMGVEHEEGVLRSGRSEGDAKTTPLASLDPLFGWTDDEVASLLLHIERPWEVGPDPDPSAWMAPSSWQVIP